MFESGAVTLPPSLIMIAGALLLPWVNQGLYRTLSLLLPLMSLFAIWMLPSDAYLGFEFLRGFPGLGSELERSLDLVIVQINLPSRAFATIFALITFGGALFALNKVRRLELTGAMLSAGSAIGITFSGDLFTLFVYWELLLIGSLLIVWSSTQVNAASAGMRYAIMHVLGSTLLLAGIAMHAQQTGSIAISIDPLATDGNPLMYLQQLDQLSAWLMLLGILVNIGAVPVGAWLPDAYPEASESGMVFLSAYTTKSAVFVLMMLFAGSKLLVYVGLLMVFYGIVYALLENDMRRILAYSLINQVGFMVCAVGIGTPLSLDGATAHAFAHILYKALLLMSAGSVLAMTGKRLCSDLGGLYRSMPVTMCCGVVGALSISAFPLTAGFTTKSIIEFSAEAQQLHYVWLALVVASAGVFLHAGIKFPWFVFFHKNAVDLSSHAPTDPPWNMQVAMIFLSVLCLVLGVWWQPLYGILPYPPTVTSSLGAESVYTAWTSTHIISQLQLLLFSGLAFFVCLPMLARARTITLDADYLYRILIPKFWRKIVVPSFHYLDLKTSTIRDFPKSLIQAKLEDSTTVEIQEDPVLQFVYVPRPSMLARAMILILCMLSVYLIVYFLM